MRGAIFLLTLLLQANSIACSELYRGSLIDIVPKAKFLATVEVVQIETSRGGNPECYIETDTLRIRRVFRGSVRSETIRVMRRRSTAYSPPVRMSAIGTVLVIASETTETLGEVVEDGLLFTRNPFGESSTEQDLLMELADVCRDREGWSRDADLLLIALRRWQDGNKSVAFECAKLLLVLSQGVDEVRMKALAAEEVITTLISMLEAPWSSDSRILGATQASALRLVTVHRTRRAEAAVRKLMMRAVEIGHRELYGTGLKYLVRIGAADAIDMIRAALEPNFPLTDLSIWALRALGEIDRPEAGEEALRQLREMIHHRREKPNGSEDLVEILVKWKVKEAAPLIIEGALLWYWSPARGVEGYLALATLPDVLELRRLLDRSNPTDGEVICDAILKVGGPGGEKLVEEVSHTHSDEFVRIWARNALMKHRAHAENGLPR